MSAPYLRVKLNGKRFCDETVGMELMNCYLTFAEDSGHYCQIFDSRYVDQAKKIGMTVDDFESLKNWMPEEDSEHKGVMKDLIDTYKADTLEELAKSSASKTSLLSLKLSNTTTKWPKQEKIQKWASRQKNSAPSKSDRSTAYTATSASP